MIHTLLHQILLQKSTKLGTSITDQTLFQFKARSGSPLETLLANEIRDGDDGHHATEQWSLVTTVLLVTQVSACRAVLEELRVLWEEKLQQSGVLAAAPPR